MSVALVVVHKTLGGHKWSNTHAIRIGADYTSEPSSADLVTAGASSTITDALTNAASTPANIIQAIVAFERLLHAADVTFTDVLVTDGKRNMINNVPTGNTLYSTIGIPSLPGLALTAQGVTLEPGGVACLLHRTPAGFSHKPGRMFVRGLLTESMVSVGGPRMIQFESTAMQTSVNGVLTTALAKLNPYLLGGAQNTNVGYVLPVYMTPKQHISQPTVPVGQLIGSLDITTFTVVGPVIRQVQRGRKRKKV